MIHDGPDFVELVVQWQEVVEGAHIDVLLKGNSPFVMYVIGNSCCGYEFEAAKTAGVSGVHNGIEDDVYRMEVEPPNRALTFGHVTYTIQRSKSGISA
jgi:hypothetical protein